MGSPSTTQGNFCFFENRIFENYMFKQISKLTKMYLLGKRYDWEKIVEEEIYFPCPAQLNTTFVFSKFAFLKIISLRKFQNRQKCFYSQKDTSERKLLGKRFIVLAQHNSTQLFFCQKNKMVVLVKKIVFSKFWP